MDKLAEKMAELADKFGPHVVDAARGAVRIEALSSMAASVVAILTAGIIMFAARYLWSYETADRFDAGLPRFFAGILGGVSTLIAILAIWTFIDPWTWTAIQNPDLWIAKKMLKL